ncbi:unnamed protein product [Didymodactylos carnosus]|uniref:Uncharacterized protein n=1 Tax=Didymodactylos carnosus TaxID=1234261 RepID=A0A813RXX3_9BILA|nr:unnamed protein product [Didymodactylos carnosus]CAF3571118.1 unnamed protein product [Didymodactylos carnosus]
MATLLTIQVFSVSSSALTNLIAIVAFSTDYWSVIKYDVPKLRNISDQQSNVIISESSEYFSVYESLLSNTTASYNSTLLTNTSYGYNTLYMSHKGIFRTCNYLSEKSRTEFNIPKCRLLKPFNNRYDDVKHGMNNPGRELIRKEEILPVLAHFVLSPR